MRVVETLVACYFHTDEIGFFVRFSLVLQLHFGHNESIVVTMELIYFESMTATLHQIAVFVDDTTLAKRHEMFRFIGRYLLFELIT